MGYSGFTGTFRPQAVITAFEKLATGMTSEPAGKHGDLPVRHGDRDGARVINRERVRMGHPTVGMVEFFGGDAPKQVTMSRARQDTANFRADVEVAKQ